MLLRWQKQGTGLTTCRLRDRVLTSSQECLSPHQCDSHLCFEGLFQLKCSTVFVWVLLVHLLFTLCACSFYPGRMSVSSSPTLLASAHAASTSQLSKCGVCLTSYIGTSRCKARVNVLPGPTAGPPMCTAEQTTPQVNKLEQREKMVAEQAIFVGPQQCRRRLKVLSPSLTFLVSHSHRARRHHRGSKVIPEKSDRYSKSLVKHLREAFSVIDVFIRELHVTPTSQTCLWNSTD